MRLTSGRRRRDAKDRFVEHLCSTKRHVAPSASTKCHLLAIFFIVWTVLVPVVRSRFIGAAVIPHGDFAYDPSLLDNGTPERQAADAVARAARRAGQFIAGALDPDVIILSTPHGIELSNDYGLYLGSQASGYATIGSDLGNASTKQQYTIQLPQMELAPKLSRSLMDKLSNESVSGMLPFADSEDMPLRWGEVIPLLMIPRANNGDARKVQRRRYLIWSHPFRRYTESPDMVPDLNRLGRLIFEWAEMINLDIAMVVSSDLSHTHRVDGPYGYSNTSQPFDEAIGQWAANPCENASKLLKRARSLQNDAKSCGFTGLVLLHGALCHGKGTTEFEATMLANQNATYYGMMAATFERRCNDVNNVRVY